MRGRLALLAALAGISASCTTDPASPPLLPVIRISVTGAPSDGVLILGGTRALTAATFGPNDVVFEDRAVSWSSSAPSVVAASEEGALTGLALGTSVVSAASEGVRWTRTLEVREGVAVPTAGAPAEASLLFGRLTLSVPTAVLPAGSVVHARTASSWPSDDRIVAATQVELGPTGLELASPIRVGISFDPTGIPSIERPNLRIFHVRANGTWGELAAGTVDLTGSRVSGDLTRLSTVAVMRRSTPTTLVKVAGDGQVGAKSSTLPIAPSVVVLDAQSRPVSGITVTWVVGATGGMITGISTGESNLDGVATLPGAWRLGSTAGEYTLVASIAEGGMATFTATALP